VLRLDGFWMKPQQHAAGMNVALQVACERATEVVWQSRFDQAMGRRWISDREGTVIPNGVPVRERRCDTPGFNELRRMHERVFVSAANWHPQKRLKENVDAYRAVRRTSCPNSCLIVLGANADPAQLAIRPNEHIFFAGSLEHEQCMDVYSIADWMFHLAWLDHCPNTVVEALMVGTPILCSNSGGTSELLSAGALQRGLLVPELTQHALELVDYDVPPPLNLEHVDWSCLSSRQAGTFMADDLAIEVCATRYSDVLSRCMR
jgi:glycosyltransferase involved in cell wall biosynthesis